MDGKGALEYFLQAVEKNKDYSEALCAIETLIEFIKQSKSITLSGLLVDIEQIIEILQTSGIDVSLPCISSACKVFLKYITLSDELHKSEDFDHCKKFLLERSKEFLELKQKARDEIARHAANMSMRGKILVHSYSRVVLHVLKNLKANNKFTVYVTESAPDYMGRKMFNELTKEGIDAISIIDAAVGHTMEGMDLVLMGADTICQSGGALNKVGSYNIALIAKALNKPVFVVAESFKLSTIYPFNNRTLPAEYKFPVLRRNKDADVRREHPILDYIPPKLIKYYICDLGGIFIPDHIDEVMINLQD